MSYALVSRRDGNGLCGNFFIIISNFILSGLVMHTAHMMAT